MKSLNLTSLLDGLVLYTKIYDKPHSIIELTAGLPIQPNLDQAELFSINESKSLFSRAANNANLDVKLIKKDLKDISTLHLPLMLLLANDTVCILESIDRKKKVAKLITCEKEYIYDKQISLDELDALYLGFAYLIKKQFDYSQRGLKSLSYSVKHWFWDTLKLSRGIYFEVILASFLINLFVLATPLFTMSVYDRVIPTNSIETLYVFAGGVIFIYCLDLLLKYIRTLFLETAAKKSDIILSSIIFEKIMDIKLEHLPSSVGSFAANIKEFDHVRSFLTNATLVTIIDLPFALGFLFLIYYIGGNIVFIPIFTLIILFIFALIIKGPIQRSVEAMHQIGAKKNSILIESLQNIETLKSLGQSGHMQWSWEETSAQLAQKGLKSKMLSAAVPNITAFFIQLNTILIVFTGVFMIQDFELTMGGLIAVMIIASRVVSPMGQAVSLITQYQDTKTSYTILNELINLPKDCPKDKKFITKETFNGVIQFQNVSFSYPDSTISALDDVSFTIASGEKVALIGRMGSGKSTIAKLLLKLYKPSSGKILIDGVDINQIHPTQLRQAIGYVAQDIGLFAGSIKDNITYTQANCSDEELLNAAKISGAHEFIQKHPLGFEMPIAEKGMGVSGGQKQSIAIARAFLRPTAFKLLDEPSNAMDQLSEERLIESFSKNLKDSTTLMVTQKMNMLKIVDRIIVLQEGKIYLDNSKQNVLAQLQGGTHG
ncbi:MAG: type I secretion system permease/ATPase [Campylobacterota bacterium]|nr:type I secretion system permease/ATPase [Campylobacterota bacterium]